MSIYTGWLVYTIGNLPNLLQLYKPSFPIDYDLYVKYDIYHNITKSSTGFHIIVKRICCFLVTIFNKHCLG